MASNLPTQSVQGRTKRTSFSGYAGSNASILLDRAKAGIRGSTPDSEALASSDDEHDYLHRLQTVTSNPGSKPVRRSSWFTEGQQTSTRKPSVGNGPFSPGSPGTATSSGEPPWSAGGPSTSSTLGRGHSSSSSFPWSNTIWNNEAQKGPPQRLKEVLPSPTTVLPPGSAGFSHEDNGIRSPPLTRDSAADPSIPFSIPLQPTLKSYRSQSYSVGQIDPDLAGIQISGLNNANVYSAAKRGASYTSIHHRPSRPSMLGDAPHDSNTLGELREVDDDEETTFAPSSGGKAYRGERTLEDLAGENAMLRQQLVANQIQQQSRGNRSSFTNQRPQTSDQYYHQRLQNTFQDESSPSYFDVDDSRPDEPQKTSSSLGRRFSEFGTSSGPHYTLNVHTDNKTLDHVKRGQWQSSLGFARAEDPPQSRRHSFAELPTRRNSLGTNEEEDLAHPPSDFAISPRDRSDKPDVYNSNASHLSQGDHCKSASLLNPAKRANEELKLMASHSFDRDFAVHYFSHSSVSPRNGLDLQALSSSSLRQAYLQNQYPRSQLNHGQVQSRPSQQLYIVTFKCLRADVFYVQDGTGLRVKKGDLVIVEADRGTDLGTVQSDSVSWSEAKQLKEEYTKKHHEWLMAFSHHTQNGTVAGPNPNGPALMQNSPGLSTAAGFQDLPSGEIKPKMIKRLAQTHEISTLREKEGGEAKAKRMCQQKVVDHRLNMEILDAEFQM